MMTTAKNNKPNHCIACTVTNCAHHCTGENYCALDMITIGAHEANPTQQQCTDCQSFKMKA